MADLDFPAVVVAGQVGLIRPALDLAWRKLQTRHAKLHRHRRLRGVLKRVTDPNLEAFAVGVAIRRFEFFVQSNYAEIDNECRFTRAGRFNGPSRIREIDRGAVD